MEQRPLLEMRSITKQFPGVLALSEVSLDAYPGEVLALVGKNGAGKSTLLKANRVSIIYISHHLEEVFTEDRKQQGLFLQLPVRENITMSVLNRLTPTFITNQRKEMKLAQQFIKNMAIKVAGPDQLAILIAGTNVAGGQIAFGIPAAAAGDAVWLEVCQC